MAKQTPGTWQLGVAGQCNVVSFNGEDIVGVAVVPNPANARLIAAAPDMLDALKTVQSWLLVKGKVREDSGWNSEFVEANNRVVEALAKAEGR